jgi:hypothetical protein
MTEHAVSDGHIGRCANDHTKKRDPRRANIQPLVFTTDRDAYEIGTAALPKLATAEAIKTARHLQALDGPNSKHDGHGNLPARKETRQ